MATLGALVALLVLGPTLLAFALLAACALSMAPMLVLVGRFERRATRD